MNKEQLEELKKKAKGGAHEIRTFSEGIKLNVEEKRASDGSTTAPIIVGYGAVFGVASTGLWWEEILMRGCMDETDFSSCFGLFNHDENAVLGSVRAGSVELTVDDYGLYYKITPPDSVVVRDLYVEPIRRGDVVHSSFRFSLDYSDPANPPDEWMYDEERDVVVRKINKISRVNDVSPVLFPAYDAAESSIRAATSFDEMREKAESVKGKKFNFPVYNMF